MQIAMGLRIYFDKALPQQLLYACELEQAEEVLPQPCAMAAQSFAGARRRTGRWAPARPPAPARAALALRGSPGARTSPPALPAPSSGSHCWGPALRGP